MVGVSDPSIIVDVDASAATAMLDGLSAVNFDRTLERAAEHALTTMAFTHEDKSGELRGSPYVWVREEGIVSIVTDVPYGRFVFEGTRRARAFPVTVWYNADDLAEDVAAQIEQGGSR
jgi:hypothetical protein